MSTIVCSTVLVETSPQAMPLGAACIASSIKADSKLKDFDVDKHGGAPMLGLNGLVVKSHGNSKATVIKNSIFFISG